LAYSAIRLKLSPKQAGRGARSSSECEGGGTEGAQKTGFRFLGDKFIEPPAPAAIDATKVARFSERSGRACCGDIPSGTRIARRRLDIVFCQAT
jgi:hypothetical protein